MKLSKFFFFYHVGIYYIVLLLCTLLFYIIYLWDGIVLTYIDLKECKEIKKRRLKVGKSRGLKPSPAYKPSTLSSGEPCLYQLVMVS